MFFYKKKEKKNARVGFQLDVILLLYYIKKKNQYFIFLYSYKLTCYHTLTFQN
jgi:hypothetical protein